MFYEVVVIENRVITESRGLWKSFEDANLYANIHKLEVAGLHSEMRVLPKAPEELGNVPEISIVTIQTYSTDNTSYFSTENRSWSIETIEPTDSKSSFGDISYNPTDAIIFQDDELVISSYTIAFPVLTKDLVRNVWTREALIKEAQNIFNKYCSEKPEKPIMVIENYLTVLK